MQNRSNKNRGQQNRQMQNRQMQNRQMQNRRKKPFRRPGFLTALLVFVLITVLIVNTVCALGLTGTDVKNDSGITVINGSVTPEQREAIEREEELNEREAQRRKDGIVSLDRPSVLVGSDGEDLRVDRPDELTGILDEAYPEQTFSFYEDYRLVEEEKQDQEDEEDPEKAVHYRLQQFCDDLPVDGYFLSVRTDSEGYILHTEGRHLDLRDVSFEPTIDTQEAERLAGEYMEANDEYNREDLQFEVKDRSIRCLGGSDRKIISGYAVFVSAKQKGISICDLYIDSITGEVVSDTDQIRTFERTEVNLQGQNVDQTFWAEKDENDHYYLQDLESFFMVYDAGGDTFSKVVSDYNAGNYHVMTWDDHNKAQVSPSAVDALANLERVYTFYEYVFGRMGLTDDPSAEAIPVFIDVSDFVDNAAMSAHEAFIVGIKGVNSAWTLSEALDVMGHEYTHGIIDYELKKNGTGSPESHQFQAINEGLADVFGEFVEDHSDDLELNYTQWVSGTSRSAVKTDSLLTDARGYSDDVKPGKTPPYRQDDYVVNCHDGIYIISHPAYMMNRGLSKDMRINSRQLAFLYYDVIPLLAPSDGFVDFRHKFEELVFTPREYGTFYGQYNLTDKQKEAVIDAFDTVGIDPWYDYRITPDSTLHILDVDYDPYKDALITITTKDGQTVVESAPVEENGTYKLPDITPGIYDFTVRDTESDGTKTFDAIVNDNREDNILDKYKTRDYVHTNFGGDAGYIALVLDTSGSMSGTPLSQVKKAAKNFVRTVHRESPRTKFSLIEFASSASALADNTADADLICSGIDGFYSGGDTNMYEGLDDARGLLAGKENTAVVIMSDGLPCRGENYNGDYETPVIELAQEIKNGGTRIYSFGFFHELYGDDLVHGQSLMNAIGSPGYTYQVTDADSPSINAVFMNIAYQLSHIGNSTHVEIRCPVNVTVRYKGEELSSKEGGNLQTDFGILTFEGEENEGKILNLKSGPDYEIIIEGYDYGTMDYSISHTNASGRYTDTRKFSKVGISPKTFITTSAGRTGPVVMRVDRNGDGSTDRIYVAGRGSGRYRTIRSEAGRIVFLIFILTLLFLAGYGLMILIPWLKKKHLEKAYAKSGINPYGYCPRCRSPLSRGAAVCRRCGTYVPNAQVRRRGTAVKKTGKAGKILKITAACALAVEMTIVLVIYGSSAANVSRRIADHDYAAAAHIYEGRVSRSAWQKKLLSWIEEGYVKKVDKAYRAGKISRQTAEDILVCTAGLHTGHASETAQELLEKI